MITFFRFILVIFTIGIVLPNGYGQGLSGEDYVRFHEIFDEVDAYEDSVDVSGVEALYDEARQLIDPEYDSYWLGYLEADRGTFYFRKGYMEKGGNGFKNADYYYQDFADSISYMTNLFNLGNYFMMTTQYNSALQKFFSTSKKIRQKLNNPQLSENDRLHCEWILAGCFQSLGSLSFFIHDEEKAIDYYLNALDQFTAIGDSLSISHSYINIGECYVLLKKPDLATAYLEKGHSMSENLNREIDFGLNYQLFGQVDALNENYSAALEHFSLSAKYYQKYSKMHDFHILGLEISKTYLAMGQLDSANFRIQESVEFLDLNSIPKYRASAYNGLADVQLAMGKNDEAVISLQKSKTLQDSVIIDAEKNMANEIISFMDDERREYIDSLSILRQDVKTNAQALELNEKSYHNQLLIIGLLFVALALIIVLVFLKRNRKSNKLLNQSLEENKVLFQEVHHRVKNNFQIISSLLNLQINQSEDQSTEKFAQLRSRIMSMSLVHELLYKTNEADSVGFKSYVNELVGSIIQSSSAEAMVISYSVEDSDVSFNLDVAIPLGLILNEAVTNSIKYAFVDGYDSAEIKVTLERDREHYLMLIHDNGIGIPETQTIDSSESLGHELIEILSEQLEGRFDYIVDKGTTVRVWFKG